jgi:hypothetical protein
VVAAADKLAEINAPCVFGTSLRLARLATGVGARLASSHLNHRCTGQGHRNEKGKLAHNPTATRIAARLRVEPAFGRFLKNCIDFSPVWICYWDSSL